jgi:hypothetical protein
MRARNRQCLAPMYHRFQAGIPGDGYMPGPGVLWKKSAGSAKPGTAFRSCCTASWMTS